MKYAIVLYSKHTGDGVVLGSKYETRKQAQEYADKDICLRCNRIEIIQVSNDAVWINRIEGFVEREELIRRKQEKEMGSRLQFNPMRRSHL